MANRKISDLTALTAPATGDFVPIVDISEGAAASKNKRITIQSLFQGIPVNVGIGTASPGRTLTVSSSADTSIQTLSTGTGSYVQFSDSANSSYIGTNNGSIIFLNPTIERARIDSSGRLLVGTSSSVNTFTVAPVVQVAGPEAYQSNIAYRADAFAPFISVGHSRSASVGTQTILQSGDDFGTFAFVGSDGTGLIQGATIKAQVDGTPGTNDMPGRLLFATSADGTASPTERFRITNDGVQAYNQPAPAAVNATATLTVANLKTGIITSSTAAAVTMTLPTGTDIELGFSGIYTNMTFEFSVINTGPNALTVGANGNTTVGSLTVATLTSACYALRRTGANAFTLYRLN